MKTQADMNKELDEVRLKTAKDWNEALELTVEQAEERGKPVVSVARSAGSGEILNELCLAIELLKASKMPLTRANLMLVKHAFALQRIASNPLGSLLSKLGVDLE